MKFSTSPISAPAISGAPYSGEEMDESEQTLADGTHISQHWVGEKVYRDSMGRTRTERHPFNNSMGMHSGDTVGPVVVEINDPVAHARYVLDPERKIAHRQPLRAREDQSVSRQVDTGQSPSLSVPGTDVSKGSLTASVTAAAAKSPTCKDNEDPKHPQHAKANDDPTRPQHMSERLGNQTIEGVLAEGTRTTTTYPVGVFGNDRPLVTTHETWFAPDLKRSVLTMSDDPRSGILTHKLTNIETTEPDPSLFQPPAGYTVKEEKGEFEVSWTYPQ